MVKNQTPLIPQLTAPRVLAVLLAGIILGLIPSPLWAKSQLPQRIASCTLATDEIALALLADGQEIKRLIAVSPMATHPDYSNIPSLPKTVKGRCGGELESLLALTPDLALLAPYSRPEWVRQLERAQVKTLMTESPRSIEAVEDSIRILGQALGVTAQAQKILEDMGQDRADLKSRRQGRTGPPPRLLHVYGNGTYSGGETTFDALAREVGAVNVVAALGLTGWPALSAEKVATLNPDYLVMAGNPVDKERLWTSLGSQPGLKNLRAWRERKLIIIPERLLSTASQWIVKGALALGEALAQDQKSRDPTPADRRSPTTPVP